MARTLRMELTWRGQDRCPPRRYRRTYGHKPERREGHMIERLARVVDGDDLPAFGRARLPYYT